MPLVSYSDDEDMQSGDEATAGPSRPTPVASGSLAPADTVDVSAEGWSFDAYTFSGWVSYPGITLSGLSLIKDDPTVSKGKQPVHAAHAAISSIIKRTVHKPSPRARIETETFTASSSGSSARNALLVPDDSEEPGASSSSSAPMPSEEDRFRELLRPPPIPGVENWGIPDAPTTPCDPALEAKIQHFQSLKLQGKHFNDSLMANKAFRNPHIYAKLVEFVDVNEMGTKFPKDVWDPFDVQPEWYADKIAAEQKARSEKASATQAAGKRSHIDFASSSSSRPAPSGKDHLSSSKKKDDRYRPYPDKQRDDGRGGDPSRNGRHDRNRWDAKDKDRVKDGLGQRGARPSGSGRDWR